MSIPNKPVTIIFFKMSKFLFSDFYMHVSCMCMGMCNGRSSTKKKKSLCVQAHLAIKFILILTKTTHKYESLTAVVLH